MSEMRERAIELEEPIVPQQSPRERWIRSVCALVVLGLALQAAIIAVAVLIYQTQLSPPIMLENLSFLKDRIRSFHSSGQYDATLSQLAAQWISALPPSAGNPRSIIVFDIDDTVLANYPEILESDFGYIPKEWDEWVESANASAIPQTRELFWAWRDAGYTVGFVTGRKNTLRNATVLNLQLQELTGYHFLVMRQPEEYSLTAAAYKDLARQRLVQQLGGDVVGCIGDQFSDCLGTHLGYTMKVPNYMYYIA